MEENSMRYYVISDMKLEYRDAFVCPEDEFDEKISNYSGYFIVDTFDTAEEAEIFCTHYNNYDGESDVKCSCCSNGCVMSAWEYAHWNDKCAYQGK